MNYDSTIDVTREDGTTVECDILAAFDCETTGKSYIIYTDRELDENGNTLATQDVANEGILVNAQGAKSVSLTLSLVEEEEVWGLRSIWSAIGK